MRTSDFDYHLPPELIAQHPLPDRDASKLLIIDRRARAFRDQKITDLPSILEPGDVLVFNDTKVIPARLRATRQGTGGKVEVFLLPPDPDDDAGLEALAPPGRTAKRVLTRSGGKLLPGETLELPGGVDATLIERRGEAGDVVAIGLEPDALTAYLDTHGEMPLPPYIERPEGPSTPDDRARYQTVFAADPGAVAAPTAGLHFTPGLLKKLAARGIETARITLHVGLGTFRTVKAERIEDHYVDPEPYRIGEEAAATITRAKRAGRRIMPVGSTATRTLEARWDREANELRAGYGRTDLFIRPPFDFAVTGALVTNFHLPKSSLLMLVAALAAPGKTNGLDLILPAYEHAKQSGYRFFSYGDGCLIL